MAQNVLVFPSPGRARWRPGFEPRRSLAAGRWFYDRVGLCRYEVVLADLEAGITDPLVVARGDPAPHRGSWPWCTIPTPDPRRSFTGTEETETAVTLAARPPGRAARGLLILPVSAAGTHVDWGRPPRGPGPPRRERRLLAEYPDRDAYILRLARCRGAGDAPRAAGTRVVEGCGVGSRG